MRVVQVSVFVDPAGRAPEELLDAWSGLTIPAEASAGAGCRTLVVQAASRDAIVERGDVDYHFVAEPGTAALRRRLGGWAAAGTPRVIERVCALRPEVVHLHGLSFPRHALALARRVPYAALLAQDHADRPPRPPLRPLHRRGLRGVDGVMFTAHPQAERFRAARVLEPHTRVFEVLESTTRFTPGEQEQARARSGLTGDPIFLWVARLDANKDPLCVLEAFARTAPELPDAHLWMCHGLQSPLLDAVQRRRSADPALRERVTLLGPRPHAEIELLLRAADFLVQGSHQEGSGYSVLEALACGTTPLVTDIPALRRITGGGAVGALSRPGDAVVMGDAMVRWARRDRAELRRRARAHFEAHLSIPALGRELRTAYEAMRPA